MQGEVSDFQLFTNLLVLRTLTSLIAILKNVLLIDDKLKKRPSLISFAFFIMYKKQGGGRVSSCVNFHRVLL